MSETDWMYAPERIESLIARCLAGDVASAVREIEHDGLWEYVATQACAAEVAGALDHELTRRGTPIEPSAGVQLDAYREYVIESNLHHRRRAEAALAHLQSEKIPFLLMKGAALNAVLYDDPGARVMVDVDVLIRPEDARRADRALRAFGCRRGADLVNENYYPRFYYERDYFLPGGPAFKIDLHVRPFRPLRYAQTVPIDAMWDAPTSASYGDVAVDVPNCENMLILLAVHAACHGLAGLKWLYDVRCWLDRFGDGMDMESLSRRCAAWQLGWPVRRALERVCGLFGESEGVAAALAALPNRSGWRDRMVLAQAPADVEKPVKALLVNLLCTPGMRFRIGYLRSVLLPGRGHLGQLYRRRHPGWTLIAHLVRVARGAARPFGSTVGGTA